MSLISSFNDNILFFIQAHIQNPFLTPIMSFFTTVGKDGAIWLVIGIILLITKKYRKVGFLIYFGSIINYIITEVIKNTVKEPRPFDTLHSLHLLISTPPGYSFPSGHTSAAFVAAFIIAIYIRKMAAPSIIGAILIACSRLYFTVHYPTDVLMGVVVGFISCLIAIFLYNRFIYKIANTILRIPIKKNRRNAA